MNAIQALSQLSYGPILGECMVYSPARAASSIGLGAGHDLLAVEPFGLSSRLANAQAFERCPSGAS